MNGRAWTDADLELLRQLYPDTKGAEIAERLGRKLFSVYQKAAKLGLSKSEAFKASPAACRLRRGDCPGKAFQFQKGHVPGNKGVKGWQAGGRSHETRFKKGNHPQTWQPIGSERINADGYRDRKVSDTGYPPRDWKGIHRIIWEEANGPIPKGHIVVFRDRDRTHIELANLEMITIGENMRRNSFHNRYPKEIGLAIQARGALQRQINKRTRHEKQDRGSSQSPVRDDRSAQGSGQTDGSGPRARRR